MVESVSSSFEQILNERILAFKAGLEARVDAMDKAAVLLSETVNRVPTLLDREILRIQQLFDEKLSRVDTVSKDANTFASSMLDKSTVHATELVAMARLEAQTANDTLQRLIEAHEESSNRLADVRFEAAQDAVAKVAAQLSLSRDTALAAVVAARDTALAGIEALDQRAEVARGALDNTMSVIERKLEDRIVGLQSMVDLRAKMNETAISKADEATELRFQSVNEFRQTLSDQARDFVTESTLRAQLNQLTQQMSSVEQQARSQSDAAVTRLAGMDTAIASLNGKVIVGGSSIAVILLAIQLVFNFIGTSHDQVRPTATLVSPVVDNTKRVDDLISRMDAMQRNGQWTPPK